MFIISIVKNVKKLNNNIKSEVYKEITLYIYNDDLHDRIFENREIDIFTNILLY